MTDLCMVGIVDLVFGILVWCSVVLRKAVKE